MRFIDPSGHSPCDVKGADPECNGLTIVRRSKPVQPSTNKATQSSQPPTNTPTPQLPTPYPNLGDNRPGNITPQPPTILKSGPTRTPTPTGFGTVIRRPDGTYVWVEWGSLIDYQKIDGWDLVIDVFGAGGQIVGYLGGSYGKIAFGVSEVAEGVGAVKATIDLFNGKPTNFSILTVQNVAPVAIDWLRLHPDAGVIFNFISIGLNVGPAVNLNAIHIIRGE